MNNKEKKPVSAKTKWIIALIILLILVLSALIFIPRYNRYLKMKSAAEGKAALTDLRNSVDNSWKSKGTISGITLESALKDAKIKPNIRENWKFAVAWKGTDLYTTEMVQKLKDVNPNQLVYISPYRMIMAVATDKNKLPEGTKIWFIGDTNSYHGVGIDTMVEPDWSTIFPNP